MAAPVIRDVEPGDEARWRQLWAGYVAFYEATVADDVTAGTWRRVLQPGSGLFCRVACVDGEVAGFAICVLHPGTWSTAPYCYLEDLFVDPAHRGHGLGRLLIEDLIGLGRARGWARLYWHTKADNATARALYDRFAAADGFVRYRLPLG